jgi:pimeloyl-ACP methyl ester carboxylesterase
MPFAHANGIQICYETFGDSANPAMLLVSGFMSQLTSWDEVICQSLVDRGFFVIRFDNRDAGLSTHFDGVKVDLPAILKAWETDDAAAMPEVPYLLSDFANDAIGLLDHLKIQRAHIVGVSMGGMIVQTIAINHPARVLTLTSIMSTTGEREFYQWDPQTRAAISSPAPHGRDEYIKHSVHVWSLLAGKRYFNAERAATKAAADYDRAFYPEGGLRQTAAIRASGGRSKELRELTIPTLVIHGREDSLIKSLGGERTASIIPGANLMLMHDMGHDLPVPLWPLLIDALVSHANHAIG